LRVANLRGRLALVNADGSAAVDVSTASKGRFTANPQDIYDQWADFTAWFAATDVDWSTAVEFSPSDLGAPAPSPQQVFAIGLNYSAHAAETPFDVPKDPTVMFTKWPSCLTGPDTTVTLPDGGNTDWEVELVVVIGRFTYQVSEQHAWEYVAGLTAGQDISERITQAAGPSPQFSLGKSLPGFGPTGPWLVTPDEVEDRDNLELGCAVNGEQMQKGRTRDLIFSVATLISRLSHKLPLLPGDLVWTGTPAGTGVGRKPPKFLAAGDELVSYIAGIGELRQRFVASSTS